MLTVVFIIYHSKNGKTTTTLFPREVKLLPGPENKKVCTTHTTHLHCHHRHHVTLRRHRHHQHRTRGFQRHRHRHLGEHLLPVVPIRSSHLPRPTWTWMKFHLGGGVCCVDHRLNVGTVITPTPPIYVDPRGPPPRRSPRCRRHLTYLPPPPTPPYSPPSPVINWELTMKTIGHCWD